MRGAVLNGRYELRSVLGRGGMGEVWLGLDRRLDREVAVKVLRAAGPADASLPERFDREARTVARLSHPNIVAIHDVGADTGTGGGVSYLVMELVPGGSLADRLAGGPLPLADAVAVAVQICDALEAAHAAGIVHRDIKPANILFSTGSTGTVKVCDFGIARMTGNGQPGLTATAQVLGTSSYMAPEQITGGPVDARTDVYALGCVLYAMLTGRPPFTGETLMQVAWQHVNQPVVPASAVRPGLPQTVDEALGALLAKQPADRPASAAQARELLRRLGDGRAATALPATQAEQPIRATAAVVAPTEAMPVTPAGEGAAEGRRAAFGPAGLIFAAIGVLTLVLAVMVIVLNGRDNAPSTGAGPTGPPTSAASTAAGGGPTGGGPTRGLPGDALAAARSTVSAQADAGQLSAETARDLSKQLDEIGRHIAKGDTGKAAEKVAELRKKLGEQRKDGKVEQAGYTAVLNSLDQLAATLPPPGGDDD